MLASPDSQLIPKRSAVIPWLMITFDLLVTSAYLFFLIRNRMDMVDWSTVASAAYPLAAAIILFRQPKNRVGWVLGVMGMIMIFGPMTSEYAGFAIQTQPGSLPLGPEVAWFSYWIWTLWEPLPVIAILIFPDGKMPSPRWWWLIAAFVLADLPVVGLGMVTLWPLRGAFLFSADAINGNGPAAYRTFFMLNQILSFLFVAFLVLAVVGMALKFSRAHGVERQQLKWIFLALIFVPVSNALGLFITPNSTPLLQNVNFVLNMLGTLGFPIAMTFAITRYHLYDIDVIIRRTLLYGALTISIGLLYFGSVILLQTILSQKGGEQSTVIIVLSTLLIAAVFNPLRQRFQKIIDRRFYRQKYNTTQILERFTTGLRSEVDLGAINHHLLAAVDESLQPDFSTLWLVSTPKNGGIAADKI